MVVKKRIRSKRVKRTTKRSLKKRSFKKSKRTKINRRKKRTKRVKGMKGGMEAQVVEVAGDAGGGSVGGESSIDISGNILKYFTNSDKYITTFNSSKSLEDLKLLSDKYYDLIISHYTCVKSGNVCGANCQNLCRNNESLGILYMEGALRYPPSIQRELEQYYGDQSMTMAVSYHALVYINENDTFIAVEVSNHKPYHMQFYVSDNYDNLIELVKVRYNVNHIKTTKDCESSWINVLYN